MSTITVIVPVYNAEKTLRACLEALMNAEQTPEQILVVDDCSTDDGMQVAAMFGTDRLQIMTAVSDQPGGPGDARNRAARVAIGDILLFVDSDVALHRDAVRRVRESFATEPEIAALFGSYDDAPPAPGLPSRYKNLLHHHVHQHGQKDAGTFWAGCGAVRRDVFLAVGGFDVARFPRPSVEDIELGMRLRRLGHAIRLVPEIQGTHWKRWSLGNLIRTDIFARAVPWTVLLLEEGNGLPNDLNLGLRSRLSAFAALLVAAAPFAALVLVSPYLLLLIPIGIVLVVTANASLFRFFGKRGGFALIIVAAFLHTLYLLYGTATFLAVSLLYRSGVFPRRRIARRKPEAALALSAEDLRR
ncbi:MAG: glycosyltransferase family 2 protein [Akkermansiaceae bacterium]|nr:glycosyltransferase family 2 protein [Armatimonadota bacterium]